MDVSIQVIYPYYKYNKNELKANINLNLLFNIY